MGIFNCGNKHTPGTIERLTPNFYHGDIRLNLTSPGYFTYRAVCRCCGVVFDGSHNMPIDTVLNEYIRTLMADKATNAARSNEFERELNSERKRLDTLTRALNDTTERKRETEGRLEDERVRSRNLNEDNVKLLEDNKLLRFQANHERSVAKCVAGRVEELEAEVTQLKQQLKRLRRK